MEAGMCGQYASWPDEKRISHVVRLVAMKSVILSQQGELGRKKGDRRMQKRLNCGGLGGRRKCDFTLEASIAKIFGTAVRFN